MESKAKLLGHAIHPMLIVFPLGLFATAVVFDILFMVTHRASMATVAYYMISSGLIGGLAAALFGWIDWFAIPSGTRAKAIGLAHGLGNVLVVALFAVSWFLRRDQPALPSTTAAVLGYVGAGVALVTSWLGGELVERLGIGVDPGANADAPSSLSAEPVRRTDDSDQEAFRRAA